MASNESQIDETTRTPAAEPEDFALEVFEDFAVDPFGHAELVFGLNSWVDDGKVLWLRITDGGLEEFEFSAWSPQRKLDDSQRLYTVAGRANSEDDFDTTECFAHLSPDGREAPSSAAIDRSLSESLADAMTLFMENCLSSDDFFIFDYPEPQLVPQVPQGRMRQIQGFVCAAATRFHLSL